MKINHFIVNFGRKYLPGLFRYVIKNLLGISANNIHKGQALIRLILVRNLVQKCLTCKHFRKENVWKITLKG